MPGFGLTELSPLDSVAHVIQLALTPIFLLSGIAALLNVFATRLARVADRVEQINRDIAGAEPEAIAVLAAVAAAATCASVLTLFVGALRETTVASSLFATFGLAVICTIGAIIAY